MQLYTFGVQQLGQSFLRSKDQFWGAGPPGEHFVLVQTSIQTGRPVLLAGFPAGVDLDLDLPSLPEEQPLSTYGNVSLFSNSLELASAMYQGGKAMLLQVAGMRVVNIYVWVMHTLTISVRSYA